ncbi:MFS transporter [Leucobacter chinensis]|uniref:MFS transporter n=1 Tax=Leucobacter chinensis TaxID=2851010 RepID=UPI001C22119F|nr:MFS transporter [Leucobacter chinensis]
MSERPKAEAHSIAPETKGVAAIVGFLLFVELSSGFLQGYYTPLFSNLTEHWGITDASITWFVTVQTLAASVCVPVLSKLGDIFGHRRMLRIAVIAVAVGSLLVALAPSYPLALVGRVLVGPLAVWLPLEIAIVHSRLTQTSARRAIGMLVASITVGAILGSVVAGVAGGLSSMTMILAIPVVILILCVIAVFVAVPESTERARPKIDTIGFIGLAVTMLLIMGGLQVASRQGFTLTAILLIVAALAIGTAWVWWEKRVEAPAIDIRIVTQPQLWPAYLISFVLGMMVLGSQTILMTFMGAKPEVAGYGFSFAPSQLAIVTIASVAPATIASFLIARLAKRIGLLGVLTTGLVLAIGGHLMLIFLNGSLMLIMIAIMVNGFGSGFLLAALPALIAEESPADSTGIATGIYNSLKTLGGALASAAFGMILAFFTLEGVGASSRTGYVTIWVVSLVAVILALLSLATIRKSRPVTAFVSVPEE